MRYRESELRERLLGDDDELADATLRESFVATPRSALSYDWCPAPGLQVSPDEDEDEDWKDRWVQRMVDLANEAEHRLRRRRFRWRQRRYPDWPVIISEGDSWVAHPFIKDLTDRLCDEDEHQYNVLSRGAGGDLLADVEREREHEEALRDGEARALVLSGGGNDMLAGFEDLVVADGPGAESAAWMLDILQPHMDQAMCTMRRVLDGVRQVDTRVPVVVHGYDYLRPGSVGEGRFLSPFFDRIGVSDYRVRVQTIRELVDRFNAGVQRIAGDFDRVYYVDLRNIVPDDEWVDEIHPDKHGFARLGDRIAEVLRREID